MNYPNRGVYLDGVDDFVKLTGIIVHGRFTMIMWINKSLDGTLFSLDAATPLPNTSTLEVYFKSSS